MIFAAAVLPMLNISASCRQLCRQISKPETKISKGKMAQNDKVCDLLQKDVEEEMPIDTCFSSYEFDSFIRGYHVYQHIWTPVERETYSCTHEPGNEQDCNAVAVIY